MPELVYSGSFVKNSFSLLELSNEDVAQNIEASGELIIKGLPDDEAVLCTKDRTYTLRQVHTSNSLLLASSSGSKLQVVDDVSTTIEVLPCLARLGRIDTLMKPTLYAGPSAEKDMESKKMYSWDELLSIVQASESELRKGLADRHAFLLNGKYRMLDRAYLHERLDALLTNATIKDLDLQCLSVADAEECMMNDDVDEDQAMPREVVMACLDSLGHWLDKDTCALDETKVCRFLGEVLLAGSPGKEWELEGFMDYWRKMAREIFTPDLSMLNGLHIVTERSTVLGKQQCFVSYFPVSELPTDPAQRFSRLFAKQKQWSPEQILPYIEDLAADAKARDALLLKYTRTQRAQGKLLYGSRIK